jgi:hypothetical protein
VQSELSWSFLPAGFLLVARKIASTRRCLQGRSDPDSTILQLQNGVAIFHERAITELIPTKNECTLVG